MAQVIDLQGGHQLRAQHLGAALLLSLVVAAPAAADTRDVFHFADPFEGAAECDACRQYEQRGRAVRWKIK